MRIPLLPRLAGGFGDRPRPRRRRDSDARGPARPPGRLASGGRLLREELAAEWDAGDPLPDLASGWIAHYRSANTRKT
ncbi:hypothetical protein GCM10009663_57420 [Kitasatospora arboriphila]|uniref:Uncharacterized protein n=1 Tax=Kitasatospora arboriphila TaxID=258052 RepID=A0ABN1TZN8_9ACTN